MKRLLTAIVVLSHLIVSAQRNALTGINQKSYTDVLFTSSGGTSVITSNLNGKIYIQQEGTGKKQLLVDLEDELYDMVCAGKTGEIYAATYQSGIVVIDGKTGNIKRRLPVTRWCNTISINAGEDKLAAASTGDDIVSSVVYIWDIKNNYRQDTLMRGQYVAGVRFSNTENDLLVYSSAVTVVDVATRKTVRSIPLKFKRSIMDVQVRDQWAVAVSADGNAVVFKPATGEVLHTVFHPDLLLKIPSSGQYMNIPIRSLALTKCLITDKYFFTAGIDRTIRKWDLASGTLVDSYKKHDGTISGIALSADGKRMASVTLSGELFFWDVQ